MRYVSIARPPKASDDWQDQPPVVQATTVYESDEPQATGVLDSNGTPIYRLPERSKMGYL